MVWTSKKAVEADTVIISTGNEPCRQLPAAHDCPLFMRPAASSMLEASSQNHFLSVQTIPILLCESA